ncbi:MAG: sugar-binding protein [Chloroflexota bacterium]
MKKGPAVFPAVIVIGSILACNLASRLPTPAPTSELALTITALSHLLKTPSPAAWTATPVLRTDTPGPLPTAPGEVRLVTGVSAAYLVEPPLIDGDLYEWSSAKFLVASPVFGIENWRGIEDLSGHAMFGWDEDYLYVAVHVVDDVFVQNAAQAHLYKGDSVEILMDTRLEWDFYDNTLNEDEYQLGISPGSPSPGLNVEAYQWLPLDREGPRKEVTIASLPYEGGYDMEVVIPWSVFGIYPQPWQHYGFAISLSDNDKPNTSIQQSMVSNTPERRYAKPITWGDFVLIK